MRVTMKKNWIIGTRGSKLALKQTEMVIGLLKAFYPDHSYQTKIIKTTGDTVWEKPLHLIGGKGLFVKEIEEELLAESIDFAVHSMKDMPTEIDDKLCIGAVLKRENPHDVFLSLRHESLRAVNAGGTIGTNSLRRQSQILAYHDAVRVVPLRGNVDTRIKKMTTENLDGIVLAYAGVKRMGFGQHIKEILPLDVLVPPSGQGAIGVETRRNSDLLAMLTPLNDPVSLHEVSIERELQTKIGGGCHVPLGINASISEDLLTLRVAFGLENGTMLVKDRQDGHVRDAESLVGNVLRKIEQYRP